MFNNLLEEKTRPHDYSSLYRGGGLIPISHSLKDFVFVIIVFTRI